MFYSQINLNENNLDQIASKKKILPLYITSIHFELNYVLSYTYIYPPGTSKIVDVIYMLW